MQYLTMRNLTTAIFYLFFQANLFATPIQNFTAKYDVYHNDVFVAKSTRVLNSTHHHLNFSAVTETAGIVAWFSSITINEMSTLTHTKNKLSFSSYKYDEKKNDKSKLYQLTLDEKSQQLYNSYTKEHYPTSNNLHDTLGFTIAIMHDLSKGKRELNYTIAEKKHLKSYHLKFIKEEKFSSHNNEINTLKMEHYDPVKKTRFTLWCAEELNFLPIKISKIKENGDETLLNLRQFNQKKIYLNIDSDEID